MKRQNAEKVAKLTTRMKVLLALLGLSLVWAGIAAVGAGKPAVLQVESAVLGTVQTVGYATGDAALPVSPPALAAASSPATAVTASATGAASAMTATLPAKASATTYITGFQVTGSGATAASVIVVTVTGVITGTMSYDIAVPAGVTASVTPLVVSFPVPVPGSALNTAVVVNVPSFGSGNTNSAVSAQGFTQ